MEVGEVLREHPPLAQRGAGVAPTVCGGCPAEDGWPVVWPCWPLFEVAQVEARPGGWQFTPR